MLQLSCLSGLGSLDVIADCNAAAAADGSCSGGGPCLLHGELCCPNDSLDDDDTVVIEIIQDEELLKDLDVAASLPPTITTGRRHHNDENIKSGCCWGVSSAAPRIDVVPTRKRVRSSVVCGTWPWSSSLDMASIIPTRRRSPNNRRRGNNGLRQPQGVVSRQRGPRSIKRLERACSRCDSTKTPHWRSGPDGPGTLCNACGMRYTRQQCKLELLPPEYHRPSASHSKEAIRLREKAKLR